MKQQPNNNKNHNGFNRSREFKNKIEIRKFDR